MNINKIDIKPKEYKLKNGLRIIIIPKKFGVSSSIGIFVKVGSSYESKKNNGISHFLEHICFKGTKKRPSQFDITSDFEEIGAVYNAFTSRDFTGYYAKVAPMYFDRAFDIVADIYLNSLIREKGFDKEKGVIVEEVNMYEDNPSAKASMELDKLLYGDSIIGRDVIGTKENILHFTPEIVREYKNKHYTPKNTYVIATGNVDVKKVKEMTERYFSSAKNKKRDKMDSLSSLKIPKKNVNLVYRKLDQFNLSIGAYGFPHKDKINYAVLVFSVILGGSLGSRLSREVRDKLGAAYAIHSSNELYATHGTFVIDAGIAKDKIFKSLDAIFAQIDDIKTNGPTEQEVKRTKKNISGHMMLGLESSDQVLGMAGKEIIRAGKITSLSEARARINAVTAKQVKDVARKIFKKGNIKISIVGPLKNTERIERLLL